MNEESRILIIENQPGEIPLLKDTLSRKGHRVFTSGNGSAVLEIVRQEKPHIIIGDTATSSADDYETCQTIKSDIRTRDIPIILLIRLTHLNEFLQALNTGADYYITKPYSSDGILSMIDSILKKPPQVVNRPEEKATDILIDGSYFRVHCSRGQILTLLYSLHENAISNMRQLDEKHKELDRLNTAFEAKVKLRTDDLERREKKYRSLFDNMLNGFAYHEIVVDRDGIPVDYIFLEINRAFEKLTGLMADDIVGKRVTEVLPYIKNDDFDWIGTYGKVALKGEPARFLSYAKELDRWYSVLSYSTEKNRFAVIFEDFTDHIKAEAKINKLNEELEEKVRKRTEELVVAMKDLESFSYSVSHDLRAPLRAIDGFSHILLEEYGNQLDEEGQRLLNIIGDNSNKMGKLIDDILHFSRMGRLEMKLSEINMDEIAESIIKEVKTTTGNRKIVFEKGVLLPAFGDAVMIKQVMVNLISNAVKYTKNRELATIRISANLEKGETIYCIEDNGAGFDMTYKNKLFNVFQRLHSEQEFEGTGAGLAIVKKIINKHGGRIWAKGKVGVGASFFFSLPNRKS